MEWYDDLCEYYGVSTEEAIELGTRSSGRKPDLPASRTCEAVGDKTFEDLWDMNPRETLQQKMDFYKDIGAWQVFRQCNYRRKFNYRRLFFSHIKPDSSIVEYGCGVAPLTSYIIERGDELGGISGMSFTLVDVAGEHLEFAKWRLNKHAPDINFDIHEITEEYPVPNFSKSFDVISIMDVFEHLPNPYDVMLNLDRHSRSGAIMVETWVDKSDGQDSGPDLKEAEEQRDKTMSFIDSKFDLVKRGSIRAHRKS